MQHTSSSTRMGSIITHLSRLGPLMLVAILWVVLTGCQQEPRKPAQEDAFSRVIRTGQIRVGYISYPPSFIKDPNTGTYSGIFHEVLLRTAENLGLRIEYVEELGWGTMIEAVSSGRVDLVCTGIWPTAARGRGAEFTVPIYFSAVRAYARADDRRFDRNLSLANRPGIKIATIDGEMTSIIARSDYPLAKSSSLPQETDVSQVLLEVVTKKADLTFVEAAVAQAFIANNPGSVRPVGDVPPVRVFPNVMMVGKGEFRLLSLINVAIDELANNGIVDQIITKYEKFPGSFERRQLAYR